MTDKREIEGAAERAADRGREEDLGFSMDPRPSLGDAGVVRAMVSEFAGLVVAARKAYNLDQLTGEQAQERVHDLAAEYGSAIMGRDPKYFALPWNSPERLGRRILKVIPLIDGVDDPGLLLFLTIGTSLMSIAAAHETGRLEDSAAEGHVQSMLADTANLILGLR